MSLGEIIKTALLDTLIGMGTVFAILILISFCIKLLGIVCNRPEKKASTETPAPSTAAVAASAAMASAADVSDGELDPQLVAVIVMTAIRAYMSEHNSEDEYDGYVVRKIRRSTWKHTS